MPALPPEGSAPPARLGAGSGKTLHPVGDAELVVGICFRSVPSVLWECRNRARVERAGLRHALTRSVFELHTFPNQGQRDTYDCSPYPNCLFRIPASHVSAGIDPGGEPDNSHHTTH